MSVDELKQNVSEETLDLVKLSLRLDQDEDDSLLKTLILAARRDIMGQVGEQIDDFFDDNQTFDTAVLILVQHLYTHREAVSTQQTFEVEMSLAYLINSLKDDYRLKYKLFTDNGGAYEGA